MTSKPPPLPYGDAPPPKPEKQYTEDGRYKPPRAGAGRPKGAINKTSKTLKEAILLAAEVVGDDMSDAAAEKGLATPRGLLGYLTMVASTDVKSFCALLGRVLPMEVTGAGGGSVEVTFRTLYESTDPAASAKLVGSSGPDRGHG